MNYTDLFTLTLSPLEIILRGSIMYWFLFLIFRFILRRDVGSVGVTDFLFIVILGDAAQNAMVGKGQSSADGMLLITTLVFWNYAMDYIAFKVPSVEKFFSPQRLLLAHNGKLMKRNMRRELITQDEILSKIHQEGLKDLNETRDIYMEPDGEITVIKLEKN